MILSLGEQPKEEHSICTKNILGMENRHILSTIESSAEGVSRYWGKIANQIVYFSCDLSTKNYYALSTNSHFSREKEDIDLL